MSAAVELREAFRIFGSGARASVALQGLTLAVEREEVVVVLGPSGSGKTTLLRVAAGLEPLSAGCVHILGVDLENLSRRELNAFRAATLGFLDQHYARALSPDLSIRQTVALELLLHGVARPDALSAADELLDRVGLLGRAHDRRAALSGGEQQRVAVCAAVAHRPQLLIVDEPAGELDSENAAIVYDLLADLAREAHAAALIVSHDPDAARIADRLVHIRDGRVVAEGEDTRAPTTAVSTPPTTVTGDVVAELRGVDKAYREGWPVLRGVSLQVARGRLLAVVGRSGTGKTTLLHLLAGLERPTEGEVLLDGELLDGCGREELAAIRRKTIAIVTQEPGLVPHLSVRENVLLALSMRGIEERARADTALAEVGLA